MKDMAHSVLPPQPRDYAGFNWTGFTTLYLKEIRRFWKVGMQTVAAPVVTTLLYMMVFVVAVRGSSPPIHNIPFSAFVAPGLIMMAILNNAFANSSSSLLQAKMMGLTSDFLTPPLAPIEQVSAFVLGAATRGIVVGIVTAGTIAVLPFTDLRISHPWAIAYFGIGASLILGLVGVVTGLWSEKFDHLSAITNFLIMPMTFLSGTFYLVDRLPEPFRTASHYNPFFYLIDGFRYGFIGEADGSIAIGASLVAVLTVSLSLICWQLFRTGYRLKT
ncbi:ABC-2 type transport system permease protein [Caulobacter ginsengisoli]|uniref:Transport permease protein n=1 Tax=Caulobacter ginsengisoli TaxID=400775 RepID=A0ABU0IR87_9CAUL|nr:ABC transporter permease [Caulobacter ginsengisoli]MDQ0464527.1 ABC-2 type transport system permease protein [Caulobacter ginsengisoli]